MPAGITITMTMSRATHITPPPLAGGGWGEGGDAGTPSPQPPPARGGGVFVPAFRPVFLPALLRTPRTPSSARLAIAGVSDRRLCLFAWPGMGGGVRGHHRRRDAAHVACRCPDPRLRPQRRDSCFATLTGEHSNHAALNELAAAIAPSRERRTETLDQGTAFIAAAAAWQPPPLPERVAYPVAVGALAGRHGIDEDTTTAAYLQAFITNLISAAVRLVPLGQSAGLRVLAALEPTILRVASESRAATLDDLGGCAFRSDIAAMRHETQYTRLFRS